MPPAADAFNQGMTNVSSMLAYAILTAYNFVGISSIVDVGGGEGTLLRKILDLNPEMVGAVLDMPVTIETVNRKLNGKIRGGRCAYIAGDFFDSVPVGADEYLLCGVITIGTMIRQQPSLEIVAKPWPGLAVCCWWIWLCRKTVRNVLVSFSI